MRARKRLGMVVAVVTGMAGAGLATATVSAGGAAGAPATRHGVMAADVTCHNVPSGIELTGAVRIEADVPTSVAPGERFTIHPSVTFTIDPPATATPRQVQLFAPAADGHGLATIPLPTDATSAITLQAGTSGTVQPTFAIPSMATVDVGGVAVDCFDTATSGTGLSVPIVPTTDGSQQTFQVTGTATCTDEGHTFAHTFGLRGVAPASVAPGEPVPVTFDWSGLASMLADNATVTVSGIAGGDDELTFSGTNNTTGIHLTTGPAAASGAVRLELTKVESALQAMNPPHVNWAHCTFPDGGAVITVPIRSTPVVPPPTVTTPTTRPPVPSLLALIQKLLCRIFRVC